MGCCLRACFRARVPVSPPLEERVFSFLEGRAGPLVLTFVLLTGCGGTTSHRGSADPTVVDDAGRAVHLDAPAHRVVSLLPSITDLIVALGAGDRLIARTGFDTARSLAHLPSLGRTLEPNPEAVAVLAPELVLAGRGRSEATLVEPLEAMGVPVYVAVVEDVADIHSTLRRLGRLLGLDGRADSLVAALESGLERARDRRRSAPRPTVLYVVWHDPPVVAGPGTYIDELITIAGGANAFADAAAHWPAVSLEEVVRRDPDYIVVSRDGGDSTPPGWLHERPGWRGLRAVVEGRLVIVDPDVFNRPGPRVVDAAHTLARALRPTRREVRP